VQGSPAAASVPPLVLPLVEPPEKPPEVVLPMEPVEPPVPEVEDVDVLRPEEAPDVDPVELPEEPPVEVEALPPVPVLVPPGHWQASKPVPLALQFWAPCPPPTQAHATVAPGVQALPPSDLPAGAPEQAASRVAVRATAGRIRGIGPP
jgi:hypothetical protein